MDDLLYVMNQSDMWCSSEGDKNMMNQKKKDIEDKKDKIDLS